MHRINFFRFKQWVNQFKTLVISQRIINQYQSADRFCGIKKFIKDLFFFTDPAIRTKRQVILLDLCKHIALFLLTLSIIHCCIKQIRYPSNISAYISGVDFFTLNQIILRVIESLI